MSHCPSYDLGWLEQWVVCQESEANGPIFLFTPSKIFFLKKHKMTVSYLAKYTYVPFYGEVGIESDVLYFFNNGKDNNSREIYFVFEKERGFPNF